VGDRLALYKRLSVAKDTAKSIGSKPKTEDRWGHLRFR